MPASVRPAFWWIWPIAVAFVLTLQLWFPDGDTGILHDTYSPTAEGQKAFYRLVEEYAGFTHRNTQPLVRALPDGNVEPTLCILGPERWPTTQEWEAILDWVESGGELLFAFSGFEEQTIPRLEIRYTPRTGNTPPDDSLPPETQLLASKGVAWWTDGRLLAPSSDVLVKYDGETQAVSGTLGAGRYVVCATSLVFSNQLLTYGDNSILALRLLQRTSELDGVTFDESLNTTGTPKAAGLLFDRELRPLTMQLILVTLLYGWWNFRRFGPLLRPAVGGRHNIVDHTDTLGAAYWRSRDGSAALRAYWKLVQTELRLAERGRAAASRLETLAARSGTTLESVQKLLQLAQRLSDQPTVDRRQAADVISRLAQLRHVVIRRVGK